MCICNPQLRTPFCNSFECQQALKDWNKLSEKDDLVEYKSKLAKLKFEVELAEASYKKALQECTHPEDFLSKEAKANTGNLCEEDNSYWYEFHCRLCNQRWSEDQ